MQNRLILAILLILGCSGFAHAEIDRMRAPMGIALNPAPKPLGEVRFLDAQNHPMRLGGFKGRLVLINLWATWCPSCRTEMPTLDRLQELLGSEGLSVVAIAMDKKGLALAAPYFRESQIKNLPLFFDPAGELPKIFGVDGLPTTIISRDGWEIGRALGWQNWTSPEMLVFLRNLLHSETN